MSSHDPFAEIPQDTPPIKPAGWLEKLKRALKTSAVSMPDDTPGEGTPTTEAVTGQIGSVASSPSQGPSHQPAAAGPSPEAQRTDTPQVTTLSGRQRLYKYRTWAFLVGGVGIAVLVAQFFTNTDTSTQNQLPPELQKGELGKLLSDKGTDADRDNWIARSTADLAEQRKQLEELRRNTEDSQSKLKELHQALENSGMRFTTNEAGKPILQGVLQRQNEEKEKDKEREALPTLPPSPKPNGPQLPNLPAPPTPTQFPGSSVGIPTMPSIPEPALAPSIRSFKPPQANPDTNPAVSQNNMIRTQPPIMQTQQLIGLRKDDVWIPSGTFAKAKVLSGVLAPTGARAGQNPHPVLLQLMEDGVGPSKTRLPLKDCFVVGSAVGDLSSDRALIRTETISCVRSDGSTVDTELKGYVAGEDGRNGIHGDVVSKQGALLAQALLAGFGKGLSDVLRAQASTLSVSPLGAMQSIQPNMAGQTGALYGVGNSADMLAKFYLSMADQIFPIIEISAGRVVDVVVTQGMLMP